MTSEKIPYKTYLTEDELPMAWYNVRADMPAKPAPLLDPATGRPITAEALGHVSATSWWRRSWTTTRATSPSRRRYATFTRCTARARW